MSDGERIGVGVEVVGAAKRHETSAGVVRALADVTLTVAPGEGVAITGPSGCGKSTLLSLIAGLDVPSAGIVRLAGREISSMPDEGRARVRRRDVGMIFQADNLLPFLTATENVSLQLSLHDREGANARSVAMLDELGLAEHATKFPDQLSGGQRQRVAVARALVHRPGLIVADEPTGSLDPDNAMGVVDLMVSAQRATGATLVLVTHEPTVAERLERSLALRDGRLA
jgi:putative ABC transport system ATP-binding protein